MVGKPFVIPVILPTSLQIYHIYIYVYMLALISFFVFGCEVKEHVYINTKWWLDGGFICSVVNCH